MTGNSGHYGNTSECVGSAAFVQLLFGLTAVDNHCGVAWFFLFCFLKDNNSQTKLLPG